MSKYLVTIPNIQFRAWTCILQSLELKEVTTMLLLPFLLHIHGEESGLWLLGSTFPLPYKFFFFVYLHVVAVL